MRTAARATKDEPVQRSEPRVEPQPDMALTLICERQGLRYRVRYVAADGSETVTPWREYTSALIAEANEQWRRWFKEGFIEPMGPYQP